MDTEEFSILTINLFKHCEKSFVTALDDAHVPHGRMQSFTSTANSSPVVEVISARSNLMPWNSIAKAITNWLEQKHGREVIISTEDGVAAHAENCSVIEIKDLLTHSVDISVMDPMSGKQPSRLLNSNRPGHKLAS